MADWMYENLKSISRGDRKELVDVGKFGKKESDAMLQTIKINSPFIVPSNSQVIFYDYNEKDFSYIPTLTRYLHRFVEYIDQALDGLKGKAKAGIFKVGVCEYKRIKDKNECGIVFLGVREKQGACEKHLPRWRFLKCTHKKRMLLKKC